MKISRRHFLLLTAGLAAGCQAPGAGSGEEVRMVEAGMTGDYARDGVYDRFRDQGFFIVRAGGKLFALSSYCTHRRCKLDVETDRSFHCPCHGSTFTPAGQVINGPARRDLPQFPATVDDKGRVLVKMSAT